MEHRWGERVAVRLTVELSAGSSRPVAGSLENVSSSGAFVRTQGRGPPRGPVDVSFRDDVGRGGSVRLPAYVVRETAAGVGIEWSEFAPRAVRRLMVRNRRAGSVRTKALALPAVRHFPRGPDTPVQPCAKSGAEPAAIGTNTLPVLASAATEWACAPVGTSPTHLPVLESTTPSTGPPVFVTAARS